MNVRCLERNKELTSPTQILSQKDSEKDGEVIRAFQAEIRLFGIGEWFRWWYKTIVRGRTKINNLSC